MKSEMEIGVEGTCLVGRMSDLSVIKIGKCTWVTLPNLAFSIREASGGKETGGPKAN